MAFPLTTLDAWWTKAKAGFRAAGAVGVDLWPNTWAVIAKVLATLSVEIDLRLAFIHRQIFVKDADPVYVRRHAFEYGIAEQVEGRATGSVTVTATGSGTLLAGMTFTRSDGMAYLTISSVLAAPGTVTLAVQCDQTGEDGNLAAGATLTLITPPEVTLASLNGTVAAGGITGGGVAETTDELRARVLARKRNPPQGGSESDWQRWASEVAGVRRVWVDSFSNTDRRVWVAFTTASGIPNSGEVTALQSYLSDPVRRPVTARVTVVAPVADPVAVTATGVEPLTPAVVAAVNLELQALFAERMDVAEPNRAFVLPRAWISEAISRATGENRHTLTAPSSDLTFSTPGRLPTLGTVTLS